MSIRVLIVDDHRILRAGLKTLLNADTNIEVIGEATNGDEALLSAQELRPDIILMDIGMPGMNTLDVVRQMVQILPDTRILMLTMHEDTAMMQEYIRAGASGYIIKRAAESELIDAIFAVWRGIIYIHPSLLQSLIEPKRAAEVTDRLKAETLTVREIEILRMIARGHTNRQIASSMNISVRTVETHRSNVMDKLDLRSRVDLVRYAVEHGLVKLDDLGA
jgi:two-component system response regulator NreC